MKFTKINDNQFRVDLSREDLASRHIKLSELAYGTPKARELFSEMMTKACAELGIDMDDNPLMIEAIPMGNNDISLRLLITKVEYPEELDMKYSDFTDSDIDFSALSKSDDEESIDSGSPVARFFDKLKAAAAAVGVNNSDFVPLKDTAERIDVPFDDIVDVSEISKLFAFEKIDTILKISKTISPIYHGSNSLYLDEKENVYYLIVRNNHHSVSEFTRICNILSEYAVQLQYMPSSEAFFKEHFRLIKDDNALDTFSQTCK